tara:strand:- start:1967 stop:2224 length:258 start_codon:yes stop_codon:yes gene_type:complete
MKNIFESKRLIMTEWDNSKESSDNFLKAIKELKRLNIPYTVVRKRVATEYAKRIYFGYSIILDAILVIGIVAALLNADRILELLS